MCGISGVYGAGGVVSRTAKDTARHISTLLTHRGPDSDGEWQSPGDDAFLSHRRLAIIGLGNAGRQPAQSQCGRYAISFNGEIYNYLELADELKIAEGGVERISDTQTILSALTRWGREGTLARLRGMYAIALFDNEERSLSLVTDCVGEKPIYYTRSFGEMYFSSELNALSEPLRDRLTFDMQALSHYLALGFVPSPETIYQQIRRVPAGTMLIFRGSDVKAVSYPQQENEDIDSAIDFQQACEKVEHLLTESVRLQLRADVPVGAFLSSGIDSSLISALAAQQVSRPLQTFTVRVPESSFDESAGAALVARHIGSEHHEIDLPHVTQDDILRVVKSYGQPFADASAVPTRLVCAAAKRSVKVCLSGDGADELFAGYRRQQIYRLGRIVGDIPGVSTIGRILSESIPPPRTMRSRYAFAHRFIRGISAPSATRYLNWSYDGFSRAELQALGASFAPADAAVDCIEAILKKHRLLPLEEQFMRLDIESNLHDNMIIKTDIASMAESIELRTPFQDAHVVRFAETIPLSVKTHGNVSKAILKTIAKKYLPAEILTLPKRGFEVPLKGWLTGMLEPNVRDVILGSGSPLHGLFDPAKLEALILNRALLDPDRWSRRVWTLFVLGTWLQDAAIEKKPFRFANG